MLLWEEQIERDDQSKPINQINQRGEKIMLPYVQELIMTSESLHAKWGAARAVSAGTANSKHGPVRCKARTIRC